MLNHRHAPIVCASDVPDAVPSSDFLSFCRIPVRGCDAGFSGLRASGGIPAPSHIAIRAALAA